MQLKKKKKAHGYKPKFEPYFSSYISSRTVLDGRRETGDGRQDQEDQCVTFFPMIQTTMLPLNLLCSRKSKPQNWA